MADPLIGRVLEGRYRIQSRLARGGMSTVYVAVDERLDRMVAVKVMAAALSADPAFTDRFTREARTAAKLTHLNAVSVYDQGTDTAPGQPGSAPLVFLVMELVPGRTLRELLRERGRLSPAEAVSIMEPVLAALTAAHRAGLVHRDVKPENILLSDEGVVKVADFGLARAVEADATSTRTGLMMGTVAYCSPEQISRGRADQRSDVYSAGVVLFELLTGSPPYQGDSAVNVAYQHVHGRVPAPSTRARGIPPELDELVVRVTDSEPSGRPLDAGAFLAELSDVRHDLALPVVPVPARPRPAPGSAALHGADAPTQAVGTARITHNGRGPNATDPLGRASGRHDTIAVDATDDAPPPPVVIPPPKRARKQVSARTRRRRRGLVALILVLLLGLAAALGGWWLLAGRFSRVPDVAGTSQPAAATRLRSAGFKIDSAVEQTFDETVAANLVIKTDPGSGSRLARGRTITLVVSKGQDRILLPDESGKSPTTAQDELQTLRIKVVTTQAANDTVPPDTVIGTTPAAGTKVKPDTVVQLVVSSGPPVLTVPNVTGNSQAQATATLKDAGFAVTVTQDFSSTVPTGAVISEDPGANSRAVKFSAVTISISKGPQLVTIPQLPNGTKTADATSQLEQLGLQVTVTKSFGGFLGLVVGLNPPAGTSVPVGTTVTLTVV